MPKEAGCCPWSGFQGILRELCVYQKPCGLCHGPAFRKLLVAIMGTDWARNVNDSEFLREEE